MKKTTFRTTLLAVSILLVGSGLVAAESFSGKVIAVSDGDTLLVTRGGRQVSVQLYGIDAPELGQEYGEEAKAHLQQQLRGKRVEVEVAEQSSERSLVGSVYVEGSDVALELVEKGLAWALSEDAPQEIQTAAKQARSSRQGLWKQGEPTPPWSYRKARAAAVESTG